MSDFDEVRNMLAATPDGSAFSYGGIHGKRADAVLAREAEKERAAAEKAWDDAAYAMNQFWARMVGWANQTDPRRETAPEPPPNPYRSPATPTGARG